MNITELEAKLLEALRESGEDCCGAESAEEMKADNMTICFPQELEKLLGLTAQQVGGLLTSLSEKCLISLDEQTTEGKRKTEVWLTDAGIDAAWEAAS